MDECKQNYKKQCPGIAGGHDVDHTFVKFVIYPFIMIALETYF